MTTMPQDENNSKEISPQAQLPEASCTADDFYHKYLNEERDAHVGPFSYPVRRNHDALPWDFPASKFLDALSTDAKNTLRYQFQITRATKSRRAYWLRHGSGSATTDHQQDPDVQPQFAAKLAAMKSLWETAARAMRELDEKVVLWMAVEKELRWNVELLDKLMSSMDQLSDDATNAERA